MIIGKGLTAMSQGVENWGRRNCFTQLEDYLYSAERDRVCLIFGLRRTGKTTMLRQAIGRMTSDNSRAGRLSEGPQNRYHGYGEPGYEETI